MHTVAVALLSLSAFATSAVAADVSDAPANATDTIAQLQSIVADLQRQVDELKSAKSDQWLTQERAKQIRGLVEDVLADADTRASLLQAGATAGWDKGFFLGSSEGNYLLRINGQLQVRFVYNHQNDSPTDDDRSGFEIRRAKIFFSGHVVDPTWEYQVELEADRSTGNFTLGENGWIQKDFGNGWNVRTGQFKAPFLHEELVSSKRLFAVERTLVNSQFTAGVLQGVQLGYEGDCWRAYAAFHDGNNSKNTAWSVQDTEYAFSGRAEWRASGEWKYLDDYTSFKGDPGGTLLGAAIDYSRQEFGTGGPLPGAFNNAEVANTGLTVDATVKFGGASIAGAVIYRTLQTDTASPDQDQWGAFIRGGYFICDSCELYAQYEWGDLDSGGDDLSVITFGFNKYWDRHNLKWQTDVGYGLNPVDAAWAQESAGYRADAPGQDGQIVVRSQLQLLF